MNASLTEISTNAKTGHIPVSTTSAKSCPTSCPLKKNGCYAESGPLAIHWAKVTRGERGKKWNEFVLDVKNKIGNGEIWRHNQAGDLPGNGNKIDESMLNSLVNANKGKRGFTYTHKPLTKKNKELIKKANEEGFTINLSANNMDHADKLMNANIAPVVVVVPENSENTTTPNGHKVVICPANVEKHITCRTCQLCSISTRKIIIGFPVHGVFKRKAAKACNI